MVDYAHSEIVAYAGMILILSAFVLETRGILQSKELPYLALMALGSGLRAFLILEVVWFAAAFLGVWSLFKGLDGG